MKFEIFFKFSDHIRQISSQSSHWYCLAFLDSLILGQKFSFIEFQFFVRRVYGLFFYFDIYPSITDPSLRKYPFPHNLISLSKEMRRYILISFRSLQHNILNFWHNSREIIVLQQLFSATNEYLCLTIYIFNGVWTPHRQYVVDVPRVIGFLNWIVIFLMEDVLRDTQDESDPWNFTDHTTLYLLILFGLFQILPL